MSLETDVQILRRVPLFSLFADDQLKLLAFSAESRSVRDGAQLCAIGERADSGYVVAEGIFGLTEIRSGRQEVVRRLEPGALIGEMALIVETQHLNGVVALGDGMVIQIRRAIFRRVLDEYPDVAIRLRGAFAERLVSTNAELAKLRDRLSSE